MRKEGQGKVGYLPFDLFQIVKRVLKLSFFNRMVPLQICNIYSPCPMAYWDSLLFYNPKPLFVRAMSPAMGFSDCLAVREGEKCPKGCILMP